MTMIDVVNLTRKAYILNYRNESASGVFFHAHQGIEVLFIHEGTGVIVLGQKVHPISSNTIALFQPFQLHHVHMNPKNLKYIRTVLHLDPVYLDNILKTLPELRAFFRFIWKQPMPQQIFTLKDGIGELNQLYQRFHARLKLASPETDHEEFTVFMISLLHILRSYVLPPSAEANKSPLKYDHLTEYVMDWVENRFKEKFSLDELSAALYLSPYHISHLFKEKTGISITEYIIARRLKEACLLLSTTDMPVNAICLELGLENSSYFSQMFKKHIGLTPKEFRRGVKKNSPPPSQADIK